MKHNLIEDNIIILSKQTIDVFLSEEKPADLIALYCFYYYTAKWQKTNQPKATTNYVEQGLKWTKERVIKAKKILINLGLISDVVTKDKKGKISGWYIKMNYIWKKTIRNQRVAQPEGGKTQRVEKPDTNALSANSLNALSVNNKIILHSKTSFAGKDINNLIELFKPINPSYERLYSNTTQRKALERLVKKYGVRKIRETIKALPSLIVRPFCPQISTPYQLEAKLGNLLSFYKQLKNNKRRII